MVTTRIDWGSGLLVTNSAGTSATYRTPDPDGAGRLQPLTLTISTAQRGSNTNLGSQKFNRIAKRDTESCTCNENLRVTSGNIGGTGDRALAIHQSPARDSAKSSDITLTANKTTTRFTFSEQVTGLNFQITDIDSTYQDFNDAVAITSSSSYTGIRTDRNQLQGAGTLSNPWRPYTNDSPVNNVTSPEGNVRITFPAVTSFDVHYWNLSAVGTETLDGDQRIFLSDFTLTYNACP